MLLSLWIVGRSTEGSRFQTTTSRGRWHRFNFYSWSAFVLAVGGGISLCTEIKKGRVKGNKYFRCKRRECRKKLGFYSGIFFEKYNLSSKNVFCLSSYWAKHRRLTYEDVAAEMGRRGHDCSLTWTNLYGIQYMETALCTIFGNKFGSTIQPPRGAVWKLGLFIGSWLISNRSSNS